MTKRALVLILFVLVLATPLALFHLEADTRHDFQRLDSILQERGRAFSPDAAVAVDVQKVSFDRPGDLSGFHGERGVKDLAVANGWLKATLTDVDNLLVGDVSLQAPDATGIVIKMKAEKSSTDSWLLWAGAGEPIDKSKGMTFRIDTDGRPHDCFVPVEDSPAWKGSINRIGISIGLTPADVPCAIEIDEIRVVRASALARRKQEGDDGPFDRAEIAGESRRVLLSPAPGIREGTVQVPDDGGTLQFGFGILPSCWFKPGDGVTFRVSAADETDGKPVVLFQQYVNPKAKADERRWFDATVSLAAHAGRSVRLKFETLEGESGAKGDPQFDDAVWSSPIVASARRRAMPNVVVVLLDTVRADHTSLFGYRRETTPKLEALANESFVFPTAYAPAPETIESVMSIFTSQYPTTHGVISFSNRLSRQTATLASALADAGYVTVGITEGGSVASDFGFDQGFDRYLDVTKSGVQPTRPHKFVEHSFGQAERFVRDTGDQPYFLFLHTYEAHTPYAPPMKPERDWDSAYRGPVGNSIDWPEVEKMLMAKQLQPRSPDATHIEALYDAGIHHADEWLGKFVDDLRASGRLDRTLLVVTSDHGEDMFDHLAIATHGHSLYDELLRVPLVIRMPGAPADRAKGRVTIPDTVSTLDVLPTIVDALGLTRVPRTQGKSFLPLLEAQPMPPRAIFAEDQSFIVRYATRWGAEKWIESPHIEEQPIVKQMRELLDYSRFNGILKEHEYYDLAADPKEVNNLAVSGREPSAECLRQFHRFMALLEATRRSDTRVTMSPETRNQLIALGYLK
jgi:arylsulfatase A-like enzyme